MLFNLGKRMIVKNKLIIYNNFGELVNTDNVEKDEQDLAKKYILGDDKVLELGARFGSVSCIINSKLNNKRNQVVVEPDERVWSALERNRYINKCEFSIVKGFISKKKLGLTNLDQGSGGYASTFIEKKDSKIPSFPLEYIKHRYNLQFNVLVADCEGYLEVFLDENPCLYNELRMIIFEEDYVEKCDYEKIKRKLLENNFEKVDGVKKINLKPDQNVWIKRKSI